MAFGVVLAISLLATAMIQSPVYRVDLWKQAIWGYPKFLGVWSPLAIIAWFSMALPMLLLVGVCWRPHRRLFLSCFLAWVVSMLIFGGLEVFFTKNISMLSNGAVFYLPYQGAAHFPMRKRQFEISEDLPFIHRPNTTIRTRGDYANHGDEVYAGFVKMDDRPTTPNIFTANRRINGSGFADEFGEIAPGKPMPEVVFLGDSFTFGYSLSAESTWPYLLTTRLGNDGYFPGLEDGENALTRAAEIACGGADPLDAFCAMKAAWEKLPVEDRKPPKLLVLLFFEGNDIADIGTTRDMRERGVTPISPYRRALELMPLGRSVDSPTHATLAWLASYTDLRLDREKRSAPWELSRRIPDRTVLLADEMLSEHYLGLRRLGDIMSNAITPRKVELNGAAYRVGMSPIELSMLGWSKDWPYYHENWALLNQGLDSLVEFRGEHGTRIVIGVAPTKLHTLHPYFLEGELEGDEILNFPGHFLPEWLREEVRDQNGWRERAAWGADEFTNALRVVCERRDFELLDLTLPLRQEALRRKSLPYFPFDSHWNELGHKVAADAFQRIIQEGDASRVER